MGAVLNMRPDLFNAAIMGVPFVDVVTTMMDESIPLTSIEQEEWGNPNVSAYLFKHQLWLSLHSHPSGINCAQMHLHLTQHECTGLRAVSCQLTFGMKSA